MTTSSRARFLAALLVTLAAAEARGNGRFPRAERVLEVDPKGSRLLLAATYGLLTTRNSGKSWDFICEASFGKTSLSADPLLELSSQGIIASLTRGLTLSKDAGCQFDSVLGGDTGDVTPDVAVSRADPSQVVALLEHRSSGPVIEIDVELVASSDGGQSFAHVSALPDTFDFPATLDIAPSDSKRLYVSGVTQDDHGQLLRSDDGGGTWLPPQVIPGSGYLSAPFIAAVHPTQAGLLFLRLDGQDPTSDVGLARDALVVADADGRVCGGAATLCQPIAAPAKLLGFALSPDGNEVLLGFGDPKDETIRVDPDVLGLYHASLDDLMTATPSSAFPPPWLTRVDRGSVNCLTWTERGIYVCTSQAERGFALGFSADVASIRDSGLTPLLSLDRVRGPLACDASSSTAHCAADWRSTCADLDACDAQSGGAGASTEDPGGDTEPPIGGAASGAPPGMSAGGAAGDHASPEHGVHEPDPGCGCRLGAANVRVPAWLALSLLATAASSFYRRAKRNRRRQ